MSTTTDRSTMFTLTIETGNAAMDDATDIAEALREVAAHLENAGFEGDIEGRVRDLNGNTVGRWTLTDV